MLPNTTITLAQSVLAGPNPEPVGMLPVPICRVAATLTPSSDSKIDIEVWMPTVAWNGKFQGVGNGTWLGEIMYDKLTAAISRGYATASTDTGHRGGEDDASWALGHPEKVTDYAYRAVHEMTVKSKAIVQAFYGAAPRYSYWSACSSGGKQGLKEAQFYPADYDGIVAGHPVNNWARQYAAHLYIALTTLSNGQTGPNYIPPTKYRMITNAALAACDGLDGLVDGLVTDPTRCNFDPGTLLCQGANAPTCLTAAQVQSVRKIYAGAKFSNGQAFYPGMTPTSEFAWAPWPVVPRRSRFPPITSSIWSSTTRTGTGARSIPIPTFRSPSRCRPPPWTPWTRTSRRSRRVAAS